MGCSRVGVRGRGGGVRGSIKQWQYCFYFSIHSLSGVLLLNIHNMWFCYSLDPDQARPFYMALSGSKLFAVNISRQHLRIGKEIRRSG